MSKIDWTREQKQAIEYDLDKPLLVSAAAGSGKTAVLIERIFQRVLEGKVDPENILVMTFTEKAALQMKQKIDQKLVEEIEYEQDPEKLAELRDLKRRFSLTQISTIHAFCLRIVGEYGAYLTDENDELILEPGFSILSQAHAEIYLEQAIDEVLAFVYEKLSEIDEKSKQNVSIKQEIPETQSEPALFNITDQEINEFEWLLDFDRLSFVLTESLTDQEVRKELAQFWKKLRSMAYFEKVVQEALAKYQEEAEDFAKHPSGKKILDELKKLIDPALKAITDCTLTDYYEKVKAGKFSTKETRDLIDRLEKEKSVLEEIKKIFNKDISDKETWNLIYEQGQSLDQPITLRTTSGKSKNALAKLEFMEIYEPKVLPVIAMLNPSFKSNSAVSKRNHLEDIKTYFARSKKEIEKDMQKMVGPLARFFELVIMVDRRMQHIKRRYNRIDFNDFEHYALRLLDQTEIAQAIHENYKEVYLDEYQDTNPIQEIIVNRIQCPRTFMVGDLKQSIYRFRHADPGLFREKLAKFTPYDQIREDISKQVSEGSVILLNENFRSAETLLSGINQLFTWFMDEEIGEIEYDSKQKLIPGKDKLKEKVIGKKPIEIDHLIIPEKASKEDIKEITELNDLIINSETDLNIVLEALQAVYRIKKSIMQGREYGEFAILGRTHNICELYAQVLQAYGLPISGGKGKQYLETRELRFLTQLINLLNNAKQDIPLASVMRSPIFDLIFTEDELLLLRLSQPQEKYFHEVVNKTASLSQDEFIKEIQQEIDISNILPSLSDLHAKLKKFVELLKELREKANWLSLSEFLDHIFQIADYPDYLATLPFAEQRLSDLEHFQQWANQFEQEQGGGLHNFISFINKISEQKLELENFHIPPASSNSIAIMTLHAAKGLEFPFVILAGANQELLSRRESSLFSFNPDLGLSSYIADSEEQTIYSTPAHTWHQNKIIDREWAEEYRLLYVSMTRAKEKLIINSNTRQDKKRNRDFTKEALLINSNLTKDKFQNLKSYAEIIITYLSSKEPKIMSKFVAELPVDSRESSIVLDTYSFHWTRPDKLLEKIDDANQKDIDEVREGKGKMQEGSQLEGIILTDKSSQNTIARIAKLLPALDQSDPLNQSPAKLTVSEINLMQDNLDNPEQLLLPEGMEDMGYTLRDPILNPSQEKTKLSGMEFGTFIHNLMRFIKISEFFENSDSAWPEIYEKQIKNMIKKHQIFSKQTEQAELAYTFVEKFLVSDLAKRLYQAEKRGNPVYREIPFTLSIPAVGIDQTEQARSEDPSDQTLVQGMIDFWFMENNKVVLLDYKSDYIPGNDEKIQSVLEKRYTTQLEYYALAIQKIIGLKEPVEEKYIWLFRQGKAYLL